MPVPHSDSHWEQAVFAKIAARETSGARRSRWWLSLSAAGIAVLFVVVLSLRSSPPEGDPRPILAVRFQAGADRLRTEGQPTVGSSLLIEVAAIREPNAELRVYRDDVGLVLRCSTASPCRRRGDKLEARWTIPAIGRYRVMVAAGAAALPQPSGSYDQDAAALTAAGGHWKLEELFEVW